MSKSHKDYVADLFGLENKRGIVTGASSGLGQAIANMLANAGAVVYALSRTGSFKDSRPNHSENIIHKKIDITDTAAAKEAVTEIGAEGLDFLINNAGMTERGLTAEFDQNKWDEIQSLNVKAVFELSRLAYPYLKNSKEAGRIVNIASMAAHLGFSEVVPYCVSKSAIAGLTRGLSVEWANDNILVNSVSPGWFPSDMLQQVMDDERKEKILQRMPLHRFGEPDELAAMVCFLVSPAAAYITGQDFAVDGGALAFGF